MPRATGSPSSGEYNAVLAAAAKQALAPLGLTRKGRSRTWLDDQRWYLIVVEFQPSSWGKGSYLNVAAMWLWYAKDYLAFDRGPGGGDVRIADFEHADDDWPLRVHRFSEKAAAAVRQLRGELPDVSAAAAHLLREPYGDPGWHLFDTAVATGLTGDTSRARTLMDRLIVQPIDHDWQADRRDKMSAFRAVLTDHSAFRRSVVHEIRRTRTLLRLPDVPIDFLLAPG